MKTFEKSKAWLVAAIAAVLFFSISYFGYLFIRQGYNLDFSNEDNFILFLFVLLSLFTFISVVWLIIDRNKLYKILSAIINDIADSEDNVVRLQRDTQVMIMELYDKFSVNRGAASEKSTEEERKVVNSE